MATVVAQIRPVCRRVTLTRAPGHRTSAGAHMPLMPLQKIFVVYFYPGITSNIAESHTT